MNDLSAHLKVVTRATVYFFAATLLLWAIFVDIRPYVAGLMLGTAVSLFNAHLLSIKVQQISKAMAANDGKRVNTGFISRICMVLIAVMISVKVSHFDLVCTIIGLFLVQIFTLLMGILSAFRKKTN